MRPAPRGYSSARLHDLKFTFTPAGADDSVHSKAPLPRGGCLRSAQTGRVFEPILFFLFQKERTVSIFQEKKEGCAKPEVQTVQPSRQKKPAPFRFRRGGENSISAAFFFLPKL